MKRESDRPHGSIADCDEICSYLTSVMRGEQSELNVRWVDGEPQYYEMRAGIRERMRAAELLGKHFNLFSDKADEGVDGVVIIEGEELPE